VDGSTATENSGIETSATAYGVRFNRDSSNGRIYPGERKIATELAKEFSYQIVNPKKISWTG
jgi:hypothetical protein